MKNFCEQPRDRAPRAGSVTPIRYLRWNIAYWQAAGQQGRPTLATATEVN
eukprot:CAMPEP_0174752022 /NCGR_PEP_ID=MMETSP1094-20130205/101107_1 /TAXON_ID=156173 /ORGANISM="Chrysochromulina brevifilum, Strain UTEX LB 985" /LENGTH=49 /DNA_ID=CAMNT_0015957603 /DNA_START=1 /DNA_END=150 /DNA_ORIENTATION=-